MLFAFRIALLILFALTCHIYRFHLQCTISLVSNIKGFWFCNRFFRGKLSWRVCSFFIIATAITIITITMVVVTAIIGIFLIYLQFSNYIKVISSSLSLLFVSSLHNLCFLKTHGGHLPSPP